ncbi:DSBA oxidoreductase [Nocardioides psychrotolerans]|uniref:DSBA-like thioredoxin domain-containing protein n=1 Tax=Nocardioides psychrotolerans TaxID=1005945 RepID=A0A1I3MU85_9ACTN|nr:DsbA family protein [Nocardioides psychrotolerans]GEP39022.1 DSBA oxidoreductase [Nocardioides psychrotolerans]SFJ00501.1 hypothetical protein SAMN05216561_11638 [Nocardioides psychrotolerans]
MIDAGLVAPDVRFWFDPVCPFAWMTSKWVRQVQAQRDLVVEWRFISLRLLNAHLDYDAHFPPEYAAGHTAGLRLLRVAAHVRDDHGADGVARYYEALGALVFDRAPDEGGGNDPSRTADVLLEALAAAGLPADLADHLDDTSRDAQLQAETDEALALTGKDVGTPILHIAPPEGAAFFGPVISRLPSDEDAGRLWDHVVGLATFAGFAELKRSLRELPQLRALGVSEEDAGVQEDWHGGSRRQKK